MGVKNTPIRRMEDEDDGSIGFLFIIKKTLSRSVRENKTDFSNYEED